MSVRGVFTGMYSHTGTTFHRNIGRPTPMPFCSWSAPRDLLVPPKVDRFPIERGRMSAAGDPSSSLTDDVIEDLRNAFNVFDADNNGYITVSELGDAFSQVGMQMPGYQIRDLVAEHDLNKDGRVEFTEFKTMYSKVDAIKNFGSRFKNRVQRPQGVVAHGGMTQASVAGTTHTVRDEEQIAFSNWINRNIQDDPDCSQFLPLSDNGDDLYNKCKDGIILCKMINKSQPGTIDERTINKSNLSIYRVHENLTLALNSAQSIGCNIVNIGADDLERGKPHLVLGLLWQIIRIGLLSEVNLRQHPGLAVLLEEGETIDDLVRMSPEAILIRWVNYHLGKSDCGRHISNFSGDIADSVAYIHLLKQIAPRDAGVNTTCEHEVNDTQRAERMLQEADKIGCRQFVRAEDVVNANAKLNLAFVANLFNNYPALDNPDGELPDSVVEESREEKMFDSREEATYRNWINSMGVSPYVNHLYSDLQNGLIIFQLYDIIKPGSVDWGKVNKKFQGLRKTMQQIENCNYAVELGRQMKFSLVGIDGKDIFDGNVTLTLALVWQLMKAYTLSVLTKLANEEGGHPIADKEIVNWANEKLASAMKKSKISSFADPTISTSKVLIDLVDAIKPGSINYDIVKTGTSEEDKSSNAKYTISMARKIGARVYALPEDIVEVRPKMVMTIFACLMIRGLQATQKNI